MPRLLYLPVVLCFLLMLPGGCGPSAPRAEVRLFAGAGLRKAVDALCDAFHAETGVSVVPDYGGSGIIMARAKEDLEVDLFMPGDAFYVKELDRLTGGRVARQTTVCYFVPVILVQKGNPKQVRTLRDLARADVALALGRPEACQIGRISRRILKQGGVTDLGKEVKESLTVNELASWVKLRHVDAAIVWDAIAANVADDTDTVEIPQAQNVISRVVVGLMKDAPRKADARRFVEFMTGPGGQAILKARKFRTDSPYPVP